MYSMYLILTIKMLKAYQKPMPHTQSCDRDFCLPTLYKLSLPSKALQSKNLQRNKTNHPSSSSPIFWWKINTQYLNRELPTHDKNPH